MGLLGGDRFGTLASNMLVLVGLNDLARLASRDIKTM